MNVNKSVLKSIACGLASMGVTIDKFDSDNGIIYITIPEKSYVYDESENMKTPEAFVKRLKETWIESNFISNDCRVRYKTLNIIWTKEMGDEKVKMRTEILDILGI